MPELPEVETTRSGIAPFVERQTIMQVTVRDTRLRWPVRSDLHNILVGQTITAVGRRAKYLLLNTGHGTLMIHLGMSGRLILFLTMV